ncbi:MAG TPA: hypothetical protein VFU82_07235 [Gammaproteobacteria bacterium]|jgi:hypothetical protein|nr:hypothetical protein [Gammaproteobacteria bacterium]
MNKFNISIHKSIELLGKLLIRVGAFGDLICQCRNEACVISDAVGENTVVMSQFPKYVSNVIDGDVCVVLNKRHGMHASYDALDWPFWSSFNTKDKRVRFLLIYW